MSSASIAVDPAGVLLYVAAPKGVTALDAESGEIRWGRALADLVEVEVSLSPSGARLFVTGNSHAPEHAFKAALDTSDGSVIWSEWSTTTVEVQGLAVSPDETTVYFLDYVNSRFRTEARVASSSVVNWAVTYAGPGDSADVPRDIQVGPDGRHVFVTGYSVASSGFDYLTIAYEASTGAEKWVRTADTGDDDLARALAVSPDGRRVYVTGGVLNGDHLTLAYQAMTGEVKASSLSPDGGDDILISTDGSRIYLGGDHVAAYDSNLARVWSYQRPGLEVTAISPIALSSDGSRLYVTGDIETGRACSEDIFSTEYATVALDAVIGTPLWEARYAGKNRISRDYATAVAVSPDGAYVYVSGNSDECTLSETATLAYAM